MTAVELNLPVFYCSYPRHPFCDLEIAMIETQRPQPTEKPFVAGMYDYFLGGTANSAVDRAAAERVKQVMPEVTETAWANRGFLQRVVKRMSAEWGIRQFIDLGAGLPTQRHAHEVAAENASGVRVIYVDNDPHVISRGNELLADVPGASAVLANMADPQAVLNHPDTRRLIDFSEPVGLLLIAVVQWISPDQDRAGILARYVEHLASGSYVAVSVPTGDNQAQRRRTGLKEIYQGTTTPAYGHTRAEAEQYFTGLEIVPPYQGAAPKVTYIGLWGAEDPAAADDDPARWIYAAVARKP